MTDRLSAFHEAGHAVISLLLGELPDSASIRAEGDSLGHTRYLSVEARAIPRRRYAVAPRPTETA
jgi:ATP-dependent Zn protease